MKVIISCLMTDKKEWNILGMLVIFETHNGHSWGTVWARFLFQLGHSWGWKHSMGTVCQGSVWAQYGHSWGTKNFVYILTWWHGLHHSAVKMTIRRVCFFSFRILLNAVNVLIVSQSLGDTADSLKGVSYENLNSYKGRINPKSYLNRID